MAEQAAIRLYQDNTMQSGQLELLRLLQRILEVGLFQPLLLKVVALVLQVVVQTLVALLVLVAEQAVLGFLLILIMAAAVAGVLVAWEEMHR
jgi:hypothetical protein